MYSHIDLYISESLYIQIKIMLGRIKYDRAYKNNTHTKILRAQMVQKKRDNNLNQIKGGIKGSFLCVCNIRLIDCLYTPLYLRSQLPPSSCPRLYPSYTPTPISPLLYTDNRSSPFLLFR